jgi:hypothetical protein
VSGDLTTPSKWGCDSRACRGASRSTKTNSKNQSRTHRGTNRFAKLDLNIKIKESSKTYIIY